MHHAFLDRLASTKIDRARRGKISILGQIRSLVHINPFNRLRNDEVQVGIALAMRMRAQVNRHAVGKKRDIGAVIRVEPAQKILIGLACAAGVLDCDEPWNQTQHLRRTPLRLK